MNEKFQADRPAAPQSAIEANTEGNTRGGSRARAFASAMLVLGTTLVAVGATGSPASAHARCDGVSHNDYHTIAFHYDRHTFTRYETSNHYHWWSGSNHTHTHVRFRNTTHGYDYFTANC